MGAEAGVRTPGSLAAPKGQLTARLVGSGSSCATLPVKAHLQEEYSKSINRRMPGAVMRRFLSKWPGGSTTNETMLLKRAKTS